ncbi:hypothetical protein V6N13_149305 [Hibiscus sabdariffa]|uniref:Uncharacterized protein n=1 Tax=Hibiscus sabdariffa TaxID=183260 RepID=A0ABR2EHP3_9ROSI
MLMSMLSSYCVNQSRKQWLVCSRSTEYQENMERGYVVVQSVAQRMEQLLNLWLVFIFILVYRTRGGLVVVLVSVDTRGGLVVVLGWNAYLYWV